MYLPIQQVRWNLTDTRTCLAHTTSSTRKEEKMNHDLAHAKRIRDEKMHTLKKQAFGQGDLEINYAYQVEIPKDLEPSEKCDPVQA